MAVHSGIFSSDPEVGRLRHERVIKKRYVDGQVVAIPRQEQGGRKAA